MATEQASLESVLIRFFPEGREREGGRGEGREMGRGSQDMDCRTSSCSLTDRAHSSWLCRLRKEGEGIPCKQVEETTDPGGGGVPCWLLK